jgi:hypothetical protein
MMAIGGLWFMGVRLELFLLWICRLEVVIGVFFEMGRK